MSLQETQTKTSLFIQPSNTKCFLGLSGQEVYYNNLVNAQYELFLNNGLSNAGRIYFYLM